MASIAEPSVVVNDPRLNAADPNLAFLASRAAIELDRKRQGKPSEYTAVAKLAGLLKHSLEKTSSGPKGLWDPLTLTLVHNAVEAQGAPKVNNISDLIREALVIANRLGATTSSSNANELEQLRSFCVGLANSAIAHERSQLDAFKDKTHWS